MKTNFEKTFKESLDQHEFDYNPDAWKALESKLDNLSPTQSPRLKKGWYLAGAAASIVAISVYYFSSNEETTPIAENRIENTTEAKENPIVEKEEPKEKSTTETKPIISNETTDSSTDNNGATETSQQIDTPVVQENSTVHDYTNTTDANSEKESERLVNLDNNEGDRYIAQTNKTPEKPVLLPTVKSLCQGENITIENKNSVNIELHTPTETVVIKPHTTIKKTADIDGTYSLIHGDKVETFQVKPSPIVQFRIHDDKYKNGVPTTTVECTVPYTNLKWEFENGSSTEETADIHFFKKNIYPIKLEVKGLNGCYGSSTKEIEIIENFNLLAPTSFDPYSADHRVNRFLPYSLTERNIPFRMIIIDPTDGHLVYETKNASNGWDGIDVTTGNLVPMNKNYIWKVSIEQNLPGESTEYAGSVMPVKRK